ncbi:CsgG/HfaB family protein [Nitratireductor pacificus]|uniref:Curli production assembly/transport component CsgG n=1 Tax=Nitratireductor pacificus pht-3B TaxID=391937 RepID=K2MRG4_9HYPH|nr:CsgG/HfaB family protein [Nitratireductor pacificus]EKF19957.1 curli production assembly/transport component CsgG [Nitratireductor pacificus pht-3B]
MSSRSHHRHLRKAAGFGLALGLAVLAGCQTPGAKDDILIQPAALTPRTEVGYKLSALPPPAKRIDVAVYEFADKTGQQKPEDNFAQFSKAVSQGAGDILIDVLKETGNGAWFNVVERVGLKNLLNERNIIDQTRKAYLGANGSTLPALRFAGLILEGGIVDFDSNVITGGLGARYLGIGGNAEYRRDVITVALRAVSVGTGEVSESVTTTKTVYSVLLRGSVFKFIAIDEILQAEAGFTRNEPVGIAVRQAIELAVYSLIVRGARNGLWQFNDPNLQSELVQKFQKTYVAAAAPEPNPVQQ